MPPKNIQLSDQILKLVKKVKEFLVKYFYTIYVTSFKITKIEELISSDRYLGSGSFIFASFFIQYNIFLLVWPDDPFSIYELPKRLQLLLRLVSKLPTVILFIAFLYSTVFAYIGFSVVRTKIKFSELLNTFAYVNGGPGFVAFIIIASCILINAFLGIKNALVINLFFIFISILVCWIFYHYIRQLTFLTGKRKFYCFIIFIISSIIGGLIQDHVQERFIKSYKVPSGSMNPTLMAGDLIISNNFIPHFRKLQRGELIVFKYPRDPKKMFVKRIIGLPGDIIEMKNKKLTINKQEISENYTTFSDPVLRDIRDNFSPISVPNDSFFVLGDNRDYSSDSRFFGFVPKDNVSGIVYFRYWPLSKSGKIN